MKNSKKSLQQIQKSVSSLNEEKLQTIKGGFVIIEDIMIR